MSFKIVISRFQASEIILLSNSTILSPTINDSCESYKSYSSPSNVAKNVVSSH